MIAKLELGKLGRSADLQDAQGWVTSKLREVRVLNSERHKICVLKRLFGGRSLYNSVCRRYLKNTTARDERFLITTN